MQGDKAKFCPIRTVQRAVFKKKKEATVHQLYNEEFDENVEKQFPTCLSYTFEKNPCLFGDDCSCAGYDTSEPEPEPEPEQEEGSISILQEASFEAEKLCKECAMMRGVEMEVSTDVMQGAQEEYPIVSEIVQQFEDLAETLQPSEGHYHERSLAATLISKIGHLQAKRGKVLGESKAVLPDKSILEEWLYYATVSKLPYSTTKELLNQKLGLSIFRNFKLLKFDLTDNFSKQALAYVIVEDIYRKELIVSFRGTSDITTALYDAEFRAKKLSLHGDTVYVHAGMWGVALKLWKKLRKFLEEIRNNYKLLTVCGHSLGAGVAALVTFLANHYDPSEKIGTISCFGIATPAVISSSNAEHQKHTVSLVLGDDIVPRLSFSSVVSLLSLATSVFESVPGITQLLSGKKTKESQNALAQLVDMSEAMGPPSSDKQSSQLLPAGVVYHLTTGNVDMPRILEAMPGYFSSFLLSPRGWKHHRLDLYRFYLASVITGASLNTIFHK